MKLTKQDSIYIPLDKSQITEPQTLIQNNQTEKIATGGVKKHDQLVEKVSELTLITLGLQKLIVELRTEVCVLRADSFINRSVEV